MKTHLLEREQTIDRPLAEVFPFFQNAANLKEMVPDFLRFQIVTPLPIEMREGTTIDYRIRLFGAPMTWRTEITVFDPPHRFVDVQLRGPYALWRHEHTFEERGPRQTLMRDRVEYAVGYGPLGELLHRAFVRRTLQRIFDFREQRTREIFAEGGGSRA